MPLPMFKSFSDKTGKSVAEIEKIYSEIKASVDPKFKDNYAYIIGALKKAIGLNESSFTDTIHDKLIEASTTSCPSES